MASSQRNNDNGVTCRSATYRPEEPPSRDVFVEPVKVGRRDSFLRDLLRNLDYVRSRFPGISYREAPGAQAKRRVIRRCRLDDFFGNLYRIGLGLPRSLNGKTPWTQAKWRVVGRDALSDFFSRLYCIR